MLNEYSFDAGIDRLKKAFGERSITNEKKILLYDRVKNITPDKWAHIVDYLILNKRHAPVWDDFKEIIDASRYRENDKQLTQKEFTTVLNQSELKEFFKILKDVATGKLNKEQAKQAGNFMANYLNQKGVKVEEHES